VPTRIPRRCTRGPLVFLLKKQVAPTPTVFRGVVIVVVQTVYEKRPRRKMVKDPVTGTINSNPKQQTKLAAQKMASKVSRPNTFLDLRPLDNFESKFVPGKRRLSVPSKVMKLMGV
jgi:hypothetical protein